MNPPERTTRVVLLPSTVTAPAPCLTVGPDGQVLSRELLAAGDSQSAPASMPRSRVVLVVPGTDAPAQWLTVPAHSPAQVRAAARAQLQGQLAADRSQTHLAIALSSQPDSPRAVVAVNSAVMDDWLARAAALGLRPDAVLPDHLALPPPRDPDEATVAICNGDWLVRTATRSFRTEAPLAAMILGERPHAPPVDTAALEGLLARGALSAPLDLLQDRYAREDANVTGTRAWRRAAVLAAVLLASLPLLWAAETARHLLSARTLEAHSASLVAAALPTAPAGLAPLAAARSALARAHAHDGFPRAFGTLSAGLQRLEGAAIERLAWQAGAPLHATVVHQTPEELEILAGVATEGGMEVTSAGTRRADGRLHSGIELEPTR
ncbi:type II secretion system protein GspL [Luteimonas sp. A277]